jgi:hypothetical protein
MREEIKELKAFLSDKVYVCVVGLLLLGAYGFAIYHPGIGMDDTAVALYYDEGLAAYMGRWVLFLLNRVFQIPLEYYAPGVMDLLSVLILGLSATCWCVLWKKICEPKIQIPRWSYAIVAGVFVSSPIISELFVFYLHGGITIAYGVCAVALLFFLRSLALSKAPEATCEKAPEATPAKAAKRRQALNLIFSGISLCVLLGFYESFIVVYIIGAITLFFLLRLLYGKQEGACPYCVKFPAWLGRGAFTVAFAMALRAVILTALD